MLGRLLDQSLGRIRRLESRRAIAPPYRWLALAGTLLLTSCIPPISPPDEQVLRDDLAAFCSGQNRPVESFERVGDRDWQRGVVELYAGVCGAGPTASPLFVDGYHVFERQGWQWRSVGAGSVATETETSQAAEPVSYTIGYAPEDDYVIVEGQIFSAEAATIEARFNNQTTLQDSGEQARFAIAASGANRLCELRVLDDQGQVIFQDTVTDNCKSS